MPSVTVATLGSVSAYRCASRAGCIPSSRANWRNGSARWNAAAASSSTVRSTPSLSAPRQALPLARRPALEQPRQNALQNPWSCGGRVNSTPDEQLRVRIFRMATQNRGGWYVLVFFGWPGKSRGISKGRFRFVRRLQVSQAGDLANWRRRERPVASVGGAAGAWRCRRSIRFSPPSRGWS